jgi:DNA-binding response OmpR family regulator
MPYRPLSPEFSARVNGLRILVAEDEPLIAMEMEEVFQDHGGVVIGPYPTLRALLAASEKGSFDVAILDVRLGSEECFPAAERLRAAGVPIVFHSGHADRLDLSAAYPDAALCKKPTAPERLLEAALAAIEQRRAAQRAPAAEAAEV